MKEPRLFLVHSAQRSPAQARATELSATWDVLRDVLVGRPARPDSEEEIAIDAATCELRRAEPSLASWSAPDRASGEPRSPQALWTLAVLVWGATLALIVGLIGAVAYLAGRG
jgi:hypothetical protein